MKGHSTFPHQGAVSPSNFSNSGRWVVVSCCGLLSFYLVGFWFWWFFFFFFFAFLMTDDIQPLFQMPLGNLDILFDEVSVQAFAFASKLLSFPY